MKDHHENIRELKMSDEDRRMMEDWTKRTWDLPPYKSPEFMEWLKGKGMTLEEFRQLPIYQMAVAQRRIINDTWVPEMTMEEKRKAGIEAERKTAEWRKSILRKGRKRPSE